MSFTPRPDQIPQTMYRITGTLMREIEKTGNEQFSYVFHRETLSYVLYRLPDGSRFNCDNHGRWMTLHRYDGELMFSMSWQDADDMLLCESAYSMCRRAIVGPPLPFDELEQEFVAMVERGDPMPE